MKVLLVGGGGREAALLTALHNSPLRPELIVVPGSDAMAETADCRSLPVDDIAGITELAVCEDIDLCMIGPELPLALGLADALHAAGIPVFGPKRAAARIESSKIYAKDLMVRAGVPTARYERYGTKEEAFAALTKWSYPLVLKENGLKAGKGVFICADPSEAEAVLARLEFTPATPLIIEEFLEGFEFSFICLAAGEIFIPLPVAQDYKAIFDGQKGANTGGMGAVSPVPRLSPDLRREAAERVIRPVLRALLEDGNPFTGFLYAGLMATSEGVKVIEFNARMGDPEAEVILPRLEGDLLSAVLSLLQGETPTELSVKPETCLGVVLSAPGYPDPVTRYPLIPAAFFVAAKAAGLTVIHMGTKRTTEGYRAAGGRVLMLTAAGGDLNVCRRSVYDFLEEHKALIPDFHYRTDIGAAATETKV